MPFSSGVPDRFFGTPRLPLSACACRGGRDFFGFGRSLDLFGGDIRGFDCFLGGFRLFRGVLRRPLAPPGPPSDSVSGCGFSSDWKYAATDS